MLILLSNMLQKLAFAVINLALLAIVAITAMQIWLIYNGPFETYRVAKTISHSKQRIVVSLTTTPYRIDKLKTNLDSILNQSIKPDKIYLNVPYNFKRANLEYIIPEWLKRYSAVVINRCKDYGPLTKLAPTLEQELAPETIIITLDDDVEYQPHVIRDLVKHSLQNQKVAVTPMNALINYDRDNKIIRDIYWHFEHGSRGPLVHGWAGVAYRRAFFKPDFFKLISRLPSYCVKSDDLVISMYLAKNNISIEQTTSNSFNPLSIKRAYNFLDHAVDVNALSFDNGTIHAHYINYLGCETQLCAAVETKKYVDAFFTRTDMLFKNQGKKSIFDKIWARLNGEFAAV